MRMGILLALLALSTAPRARAAPTVLALLARWRRGEPARRDLGLGRRDFA
jgi:hypothetical protein